MRYHTSSAAMKSLLDMDVAWHAVRLTTRHLFLVAVLLTVLHIRSAKSDQVLFSCNFETACVNAIDQDKNDEIDFQLGQGWQGEWTTGPEVDHTFRNSTGYYFFIDANGEKVQMDDRATIYLPIEHRRFRAGRAELSLAYHMLDNYGLRNQMGTLSVYMLCAGEFNRTWRVDGNQGDRWQSALIQLECDGEPVQVSIEAIRHGVQSDIAIDDIRFVDLFEGDPLPPATLSTQSDRPSSSRSTPPPSKGVSGSTLLTNPGRGGTAGRTVLPGGTGSITTPPVGRPGLGIGLDIIIPIAAAALVGLVLIIILILVLLVHKRRKLKKTGEITETPSQLYENNIFAEPSPDRKYESLQGPLSNSDRIYEELNHKKSTVEMRRNDGLQARVPHPLARMNGFAPQAMRRSMPELGDNFYDGINERLNAPVSTNNNAHARSDNSHNNFVDRSQTYHPGRVSYHSNVEDHSYFTLMPDVVSSTAFQDDRILFTIPPPPSSTPPPLPPPPRDYDYDGTVNASMPIEEDDIVELNEYHDVIDVGKQRPRSINSNFDDEDDFGRHRMAMDMDIESERGFALGSDLRLSRDTDISGRLEMDFDMDVDGEVDIHNMDTLEITHGYDRTRDRRSRDMELERNLDHLPRYGDGNAGSVDRRMNVVREADLDEDAKNVHPSPYRHHIAEDAQGHIRMVNLNYSPSVVHV